MVALVFLVGGETDAQEPSRTSVNDRFCEVVEGLASGVMMERQSGTMMSEAIKRVTDAALSFSKPSDDPTVLEFRDALVEISKGLAIEAYATPKLISPESKKDAIVDFSSRQFSVCLQMAPK